MLSDSLLWWVRTYGIDGFRHDAAKHIPLGFWRKLTYKINSQVITPEQRPVYQLGETYGSTELINSYISKGLLDAPEVIFGLMKMQRKPDGPVR
jgi:glycosidase